LECSDTVRSSAFGVNSDFKTGDTVDEEQFDFEKLKVYQRALEYVDFVYKMTKPFPREEMFSLTDQFRRAATSICLNIAEGSGGSKIEFRQYLKISRRSVRECIAITEISWRQSYIDRETRIQSRAYCTEISKMLNGLIKSVTGKTHPE
jgi:four helix bundle protein